jgi:prepilin-type processing-associated H-X9-DG protein
MRRNEQGGNNMPKWASKLIQGCGCVGLLLLAAAVVFPILAKEHHPPQRIFCALNEKQLGLGIQEYVQDNDNCMPDIAATSSGKDTWRSAIFPYTKSENLYHCPSRRDSDKGPDGYYRSYAANDNGDAGTTTSGQGNGAFAAIGSKPINVSDIEKPAHLIALCESAGGNTPEFNIDDPVHFGPGTRLLWAGHSGGSNYQLVDGHVKWYRPKETKDFWHRDRTVPLTPAALAILSEAQSRAGN